MAVKMERETVTAVNLDSLAVMLWPEYIWSNEHQKKTVDLGSNHMPVHAMRFISQTRIQQSS